jgi:N-acetylneuraminic acid mutarotase
MKRIVAILSLLTLAACGGGGGGGASSTPTPPVVPPAATYAAKSGVAQKGPLIRGSAVTAQELDSSLSPTGKQYSYQTTSDFGTFSPTNTFTSQYIGVSATGYYFDEVANAVSTGLITLNGYSDIATDKVLNVNLLTTLEYQRIQSLVTKSNMTFAAARTQAEGEVLSALNIPTGSYGPFSTLDLSGSGDGDHILAAISSIFVYGNSAGLLSQLIDNFQSDIGANGVITNTKTTAALVAAAEAINPAAVAANLTTVYASDGVVFTASDISDWIAQSGDGVIGKFTFQVSGATPSSGFSFPSFVVSQFAGTPVSVTAGQLSINGKPASGTVSFNAGDAVALSPGVSTLPNGVLSSYLVSGSKNLAKVSFFGANGWSPTGSMTATRIGQTATLLPNGTVLVAGGLPNSANPTGGSALASAEIYNPATGAWTLTGSMTAARESHIATLLPNGTVLVAGGVDNNSVTLASAEIYNPATGTWTVTGIMSMARSYPTATLLPNGTVLVAGGGNNSGYLASAEIYHPATGAWTLTGSMTTARNGDTATLLANGKVLASGGSTASAEIYDPVAGTWSLSGSMSTARTDHIATLLANGTVLVAGGVGLATAEIYDPVAATWTLTGSMTTGRADYAATLLPNGTVLVSGGSTSSSPSTSSAEIYDPAAGAWTVTGSMNTPRRAYTATLLPNGAVLVAGGITDISGLASAEIYY